MAYWNSGQFRFFFSKYVIRDEKKKNRIRRTVFQPFQIVKNNIDNIYVQSIQRCINTVTSISYFSFVDGLHYWWLKIGVEHHIYLVNVYDSFRGKDIKIVARYRIIGATVSSLWQSIIPPFFRLPSKNGRDLKLWKNWPIGRWNVCLPRWRPVSSPLSGAELRNSGRSAGGNELLYHVA